MTDNVAGDYLQRVGEIVAAIHDHETDHIRRAAGLAATAIAAGGYTHLFGTGHSHAATMDVYPRIGGYDGFNPIVEPSLTKFQGVVGNEGLRQISFFEGVPGLAEAFLVNQMVAVPDAMVLVSNSGINTVVVEMAIGCRERGIPVIAVTSRKHSDSTQSRHPSGSKLLDLADVVIDTHVPVGDSIMEVEGLRYPVGAVSSIASVSIIQSLVSQTAAELVALGAAPNQIPSHNRHDAAESGAEASTELSLVSWARRRAARLESLSRPDGPWGAEKSRTR